MAKVRVKVQLTLDRFRELDSGCPGTMSGSALMDMLQTALDEMGAVEM